MEKCITHLTSTLFSASAFITAIGFPASNEFISTPEKDRYKMLISNFQLSLFRLFTWKRIIPM